MTVIENTKNAIADRKITIQQAIKKHIGILSFDNSSTPHDPA
jgi:hypothetical protein